MSRRIVFGLAGFAALVILLGRSLLHGDSAVLHESPVRPPEPAPLCPWRQPEADLRQLFPEATRYEVETRILTGLRAELQHRLGRTPTGDENALRLFRIYHDNVALGTVSTRRVKGEHGAIELVLGTDLQGRVTGLLFQRLREPEPVAQALADSQWRRAFEARDAESSWTLDDFPPLPSPARPCAEAVLDGARSQLILLASANRPGSSSLVSTHHH